VMITGDSPLVVGNWKMNGTESALSELGAMEKGMVYPGVKVVICPPATLIIPAAAIAKKIEIGAQDCHAGEGPAFTGRLSPSMLFGAGARWVIVGHSECRALAGETDDIVRGKAERALEAGLAVILCVGEPKEARDRDVADSRAHRPSSPVFRTVAGTPATSTRSATSSVTTAPAAITARSPIVRLSMTIAPMPTYVRPPIEQAPATLAPGLSVEHAPIVVWCPTSTPRLSTVKSPIDECAAITLATPTNTPAPSELVAETTADGCTTVANRNPRSRASVINRIRCVVLSAQSTS